MLHGAAWGRAAYDRLVDAVGDDEHRVMSWSTADVEGIVGVFAPQFVFMLNWSQLIPQRLLDRAEFVNFHCTTLPYGRGGHPIENLIVRRHTETFITAHRATADVDAGPIYAVRGPISLAGAKHEILERFVAPCVSMMSDIIMGATGPPLAQEAATRFTRFTAAEAKTLWALRARGGI